MLFQHEHGAVAAAEAAGLPIGVEPEIQLVALDAGAAVGGGGHTVGQIAVVGVDIEAGAVGEHGGVTAMLPYFVGRPEAP